jgi:hypothetical protein
MTADFAPFADVESFDFANYEFSKRQSSAEDVNMALRTWAARSIKMTGINSAPFLDHKEMVDTIDAIPYGECSWSSFDAVYGGPVDEDSPPYMRTHYTVHTRNVLEVVRAMLANSEFHGHFDYAARQDFVPTSSNPNEWQRQYSDVMSGEWAWRESVSAALQS